MFVQSFIYIFAFPIIGTIQGDEIYGQTINHQPGKRGIRIIVTG